MMAPRPGGPGLLPGGLTAGGPPPGSIPVSMAGIPVSGKYIVTIITPIVIKSDSNKPAKNYHTTPSQQDSDAKRMGLSYLGWGRYGQKDATGHGVTTHYVKDNKLIPKQQHQLMHQQQLGEEDDASQEDVIMSKMNVENEG